jgi:hypothetical protein
MTARERKKAIDSIPLVSLEKSFIFQRPVVYLKAISCMRLTR